MALHSLPCLEERFYLLSGNSQRRVQIRQVGRSSDCRFTVIGRKRPVLGWAEWQKRTLNSEYSYKTRNDCLYLANGEPLKQYPALSSLCSTRSLKKSAFYHSKFTTVTSVTTHAKKIVLLICLARVYMHTV